MEKKYILSEQEMRKIYLYLEHTIPNKEELDTLGNNTYEIINAVHEDLLEDISDNIGLNPDTHYIDIKTLELVEW